MIGPTTIVFGAIALLVIFIIAKGLKIVRQSESILIERFGKYHKTLNAGINIIIPIMDQPRHIMWRILREGSDGRRFVTIKQKERIDLRETVYDFAKQNVITRDNVVTEINALLYFQINDPLKAVYEISNLPNAIEKLTQTTLRNVIGELDLDDCLSSRDTINAKLRSILDDATNKWGVKVNRVELQDINPPRDIKEAMEKQMRAERDKRAVIIESEGSRRSQILESEGKRDADINEAEGYKQANVLRAEGEAEARIKVAKAEAEAIRQITDAITDGKGDPTNYLIAVKYIETLEKMVDGQGNKVVYMPYEATGLLSSIGGIKDMLELTSKSE